MKKLLIVLLLSACGVKIESHTKPAPPLSDEQRFDRDCQELKEALEWVGNSEDKVKAMKEYVDGIEKLRKVYSKNELPIRQEK